MRRSVYVGKHKTTPRHSKLGTEIANPASAHHGEIVFVTVMSSTSLTAIITYLRALGNTAMYSSLAICPFLPLCLYFTNNLRSLANMPL